MLTALAMCHALCEVSLSSSFNCFQGFIFLIFLAAVIDFGIWTLGDS